MTDDRKHDVPDNRLDAATAARLRELGEAPVDTTALESRLAAAMDERAQAVAGMARVYRLRRVLGVAAGLALAAVVFVSLMGRVNSTAHAAVLDLTEVHAKLLDKQSSDPHVATVEAVNAIIADRSTLTEKDLQTLVRSCCLRDVEGTLRAAVLLEQGDLRVSIVVADGAKFATPMGRTLTVDGNDFHIHRMGELTMVMSRRNDRWLCVMADAPEAELLAVASRVRF